MKNKKPVTIITGYLGSGKTTLINELLKQNGMEGIALIVNDMGSVNIDASLIKKSSVVKADSQMIELTNGCICCTLQEAFMTQVEDLSKEPTIHRILVEASGISNPASIANGFLMYEEVTENTGVYLDSIVTVVDADRIYAEFLDELKEKSEEGQDTDPDIINLVMDQIEFCNIVVLNKCDLLSKKQIEEVKKVVKSFQKVADVLECVHGKIAPDLIFKGEKFDYELVMNSSAVQQALERNQKMEESNLDEYGIHSFVYEEVRPFDYDLFMEFVEKEYPEQLIRAKGYIWFADDDMHVQLFEQAGRNASVTEVSNWVAALPEKDQQEFFETYPEEKEEWDATYGDRLNQIVFIGKDYDQKKIEELLNHCLARV